MENLLERVGLTTTEAKVYLALLQHGESTSGEILKNSGLNTGRIYEVLAGLERKGLAGSIQHSDAKRFFASPPERIRDYLETQKREIESHEAEVEKMLPDLRRIHDNTKQDIPVELYLGAEGQRTAYTILHEQAANDKELLVYGIVSAEKYPPQILDILKYFVYKDRKAKGLRTRKLAANEARGIEMYAQDDSVIRFLPYTTMVGFEVLGDTTMIMYEREPIITLLIHGSDVADDYRQHFEFLWKNAEP